ncbi:MAG TPA: M15 family metallopeptidase [Caulobacteraceae bacterium]|nr:M15 family metallopeptidase [Caulobacteraceae bacterium]
MWRIAGALIALGLAYALGELVWCGVAPRPAPVRIPAIAAPAARLERPAGPLAPAVAPPPVRSTASCDGSAFETAARRNAQSLVAAAWSVFGRPEAGWAIYAPLTAREIGSACAAESEGFARALSAWQAGHGLRADGIMDEPTLDALRLVWIRRRPFVAAVAHGDCPAPPPIDRLAAARPDEGYGAKPVQLRPEALNAYRALVQAARAQVPAVAADHRLLTLFSGFRDPAADAARCDAEGGCGKLVRARCSAHGTGLAVDLYLGAAPGYPPESSADANRLFQSRSAAYRWLVGAADRFGFVNYPFEPWHWEWVGPPAS